MPAWLPLARPPRRPPAHLPQSLQRWTCHGCDPAVLRAICEQVFELV